MLCQLHETDGEIARVGTDFGTDRIRVVDGRVGADPIFDEGVILVAVLDLPLAASSFFGSSRTAFA